MFRFLSALFALGSSCTVSAAVVYHDLAKYEATNPVTDYADFSGIPLNPDSYTVVPGPYTVGIATFQSGGAVYDDVGPGPYLSSGGAVSLHGVHAVGFVLGAYEGAYVSAIINNKVADRFFVDGSDYPFLGFSSTELISSVTFHVDGSELDFYNLRFTSGSGAIPEPDLWTSLICGFGMVGTMTRYRRRQEPSQKGLRGKIS